MPRITPLHWKRPANVFKEDGFILARETDDHLVYNKPGIARPIIIPKYNEVGLDIITNNMRTANMSRKKFLKLLEKC